MPWSFPPAQNSKPFRRRGVADRTKKPPSTDTKPDQQRHIHDNILVFI